jgi:polyphosphate:AMP phosphotransferase
VFETAELGQKVSKSLYQERLGPLRRALLMAQMRMREADFPVIVFFAGVEGAGMGHVVNRLNEVMDPRWLWTRAFDDPSEEDRERPPMGRFFRALPPAGRIGLMLRAWHWEPLIARMRGGKRRDFETALQRIVTVERMLADDGALILKFWLHLSRDAQEKRFRKYEKDPHQSWRVTAADWECWKKYDRFIDAAEQLVNRTSASHAPWHVVESADFRYRNLRVYELLHDAVEKRLAAGSPERSAGPRMPPPRAVTNGSVSVLARLDMSKTLSREDYPGVLAKLQARLNGLHREARERRVSTVIVFEGWDAAGKGGAIRRLTPALDARAVRVIPTGAPTDEERAHHYLWRFWRYMPRPGRFAIFDRSWYGRVLVERVEGLAGEDEWRRAYREIRLFEDSLVSHGTVLVKFWMHITKDEQERRFIERKETP